MCEKPCYRELEQRCKVLEKKFAKRQQAEEALLELEKRYRDLFDNINDLIMIHDLKGSLLNVNPAVSKLSGFTFEEIIGRPISDFIFPDLDPYSKTNISRRSRSRGTRKEWLYFRPKTEKNIMSSTTMFWSLRREVNDISAVSVATLPIVYTLSVPCGRVKNATEQFSKLPVRPP